MTQPGVVTPYSTVSPLFGATQSWMPPDEQERLKSYLAYEDMYWNRSDTLKLMTRGGTDEDPVYVPTPMIVVETINRYVGASLALDVDEDTGTPESRAQARLAFSTLFERERFYSRYYANKRFGCIRGDWVWHVLADPSKAPGSRLSVLPVDPASYFRIEDPNNPDRLLGCHLVEQIQQGEDVFVKRLTYRKVLDVDGNPTGGITTETALFKPDEWFDPTKAPQQTLTSPTPLPAGITTLPVYHIPNFGEPQNPWGSSELRGHERLIAAVNGSITDEDITLALEGLGVYWTENARRPIDPVTQEVVDWNIYPGRIIQGAVLNRVQGVGSVVPYGDHIERMVKFLKGATATGDAAIGQVDVQVAESGVALALHMAPTMAKAAEKDQIILDVLGQMYFDLRSWFLVYEAINFMDVMVRPKLGDKLPANKRAAVELVALMMSTSPPIMSAFSARRYLEANGLAGVFDDNEQILVSTEQAMVAQWATDTTDQRASEELDGADDIGAGPESEGSVA